MVRHTDRSMRVLYNRCPHRGVKIAGETCGNTGRFFRCPYHAWSFRTDGCDRGHSGTGGIQGGAARRDHGGRGHEARRRRRDLSRLRVRAPRRDGDLVSRDYFGESLSTIDNMVDRSPVGKLEVAGGVLRYIHRCNWKMLVENLTDTMHPMVAHESSAGTAVEVWKKLACRRTRQGTRRSRSTRHSFRSYEFYQNMGIRTWANGHGHTGVSQSIHSNYSVDPRLLGGDGGGPWRGADQGDPGREPAQHRVFPEPDDEGPDPGVAHLQASGGGPDDGGILDVPPGRRAGQAAGADGALLATDQRPDLAGGARRPRRCTSARRKRCMSTSIRG